MSLSKSISIRGVSINPPILLAPMSGVSDMPFRSVVKRFGVGLVMSEMLASKEIIINKSKNNKRTMFDKNVENPIAVQVAGADPKMMAWAAKLSEDFGADMIDINMGCPAKIVVNKNSGSALMRDENLAKKIFKAVVAAVQIPVTLKMRTGWNESSRNAPELARIAEDCGISMITVHGRTRCQFYRGHSDWHFISKVKKEVNIPVIANGDIVSNENARDCLKISGADGLMIGRGVYGRPWFPKQVAHYLQYNNLLSPPSIDIQQSTLLEHYESILSLHGIEAGVRIARKHISWYVSSLPGASQFLSQVNKIDDPRLVFRKIGNFYKTIKENHTQGCRSGINNDCSGLQIEVSEILK